MFGLIKNKRNSMLAFHELTPRFKKLKRRASLEFCVHLDMSQIGIVWDFQNSEYLKSYRDFCTSFSETQVKETWEKDFKTMKNINFKIPRHSFVKQTIPIWLISKRTQNSKLARRFSFLNRGVSSCTVHVIPFFLIEPNIF